MRLLGQPFTRPTTDKPVTKEAITALVNQELDPRSDPYRNRRQQRTPRKTERAATRPRSTTTRRKAGWVLNADAKPTDEKKAAASGLGSPASETPVKRKRGRPRREESKS